ncbi:MAG: FlgO family outer membrane protein, partial [Chthoniobacterales bacterium]
MALPDPSAGRAPSRGAVWKQFCVELKRRKVYRVAVAYVVISWVLIQVATQVFPFFEVPNWTIRLVILALVLGFPIAIILAWAYDITPAGIRRTADLAADAVKTTPKASATTTAAPEKSVAVLPFENLSDDRENAFFADGVHDDILSRLAQIADLKVISRISAQSYRETARDLPEIGQALGVAYILEGTVRRVGNRVRVNAQLINAPTDRYVWAESFDRELTDLFGIQSELAERIVKALEANLSPREKAGLLRQPTTSLEAYDLYVRARDLFHWSGSGDAHENAEKALPLIDQALARDPQFALAYCLASRIHSELFGFGYDKSRERLAKAKGLVETALRLCPELAEAHLALAFYHYYESRDFAATIRELTLAQGRLPNDAEVASTLGMIDRRRGRWDESILHFERARQLDPRNVLCYWNLAETLAMLGRYQDADRVFAEAVAISPGSHLVPLARADLSLREKGETAPLREALRHIPREFDPGGAVTAIAVRLALMEHEYDEAEKRLRSCALPKFNDVGLCGFAGALDEYTVPREWYAGLIALGRGQEGGATRAFGEARTVVLSDLAGRPEAPKSLLMLGLLEAMLGRAEEASAAGRRGVTLLPLSADALDGPLLAANLAVIYAQLGEKDLALDELERIVRLPGGPTPGTLRIEPEWNSLRNDLRFQDLLA